MIFKVKVKEHKKVKSKLINILENTEGESYDSINHRLAS